MRSAARWADYNFVFGDVRTAGQLTALTTEYAAQFGRKVATYVLIAVVAEETESKALEVADHLADTVDIEAVESGGRWV